MTSREARITRWQLGIASLVVAASFAWILDAVLRDPDVPFLTSTRDPDWIGVVEPVNRDAIAVDREAVPRTTFVRRFSLEAVPASATLRVRALGDLELWINDRRVLAPDPDRSWKRVAELDVRAALAAGENEVRALVANARGPALLQLRLPGIVETDPSWVAFGPDSRPRETTRASDVRIDPQSLALPGSGAVLARRAEVFGLLFALGVLLYLAGRRSLPGALRERAPEAVLAAATLFAFLVYALRSSRLPVLMGFDIAGHLAYVDFLLEERSVPLATQGGSMYHPPLGHLVFAAIAAAFELGREDAAARWLYRLPTFLAGLGNVFAVAFAAHRLFDGDRLRTSLSVAFAALLPMNLYMSAYVSNEPLHAFLVSLSLCTACALLVRPGLSFGGVAGLSASLGLAILTKFTALVAVPICAFFVAAKVWLADRAGPARAAAAGAGVLLGAALLGGWFYVRSVALFGRLLVGNWDLPGRFGWWEQPGFHTPAYYTSFGQALSHPFFAGYASFWDGLYSTFWGDGLVAGMARLATRHEAWNYEFMTAAYWLAFPATVLLAVGCVRAFRFAATGGDLGRRLAMSLQVAFLYAVSLALVAVTLRLPYYAQAKAFYALSAVVPISLCGGLGLAWVFERLAAPRWLPVRAICAGWLATLAGAIVLSFLG